MISEFDDLRIIFRAQKTDFERDDMKCRLRLLET
jgi:hypothetical protein